MTSKPLDNFFSTQSNTYFNPNNLSIFPKQYRGSENYNNQKNEFSYLRDYDQKFRYQEMDQYWSGTIKQTYDGLVNKARKSNKLKRFPLLKQFDEQLKAQDEREEFEQELDNQSYQQNQNIQEASKEKKKLSPRVRLIQEVKQHEEMKQQTSIMKQSINSKAQNRNYYQSQRSNANKNNEKSTSQSPTCSTKIKNREILRNVAPSEIFHSVVLNSARRSITTGKGDYTSDYDKISSIRPQQFGRYGQLSAIGDTSQQMAIGNMESTRLSNFRQRSQIQKQSLANTTQGNRFPLDLQRISKPAHPFTAASPDLFRDSNVNSSSQQNSSRRAFLRSSPRPMETLITDHKRLINNHNDYKSFLTRETEQYKVSVFENFKAMKTKMNQAFLRQQENKKFFKGNNAVPEEQIKIKEEDDATIDKISSIFKYVHRHQRAMSNTSRSQGMGGVGNGLIGGVSQQSGRGSSFANKTMNNSELMNNTQIQ